jgi:cardiolipin-specific phospholipase
MSQLASRIEQMKKAELALISFASRFSNTDNENSHTLELFDTQIPRSSVPLKDGVKCQLYKEEGDGKDDNFTIHGIKVESKLYSETEASVTKTPLVLLHGYANGCLYFYRNLLGLSNYCFGGKVYALDMLGWGLSSRPQFKTKTVQGSDTIDVAEQFFVESLEEWRKVHQIDKMTLAGHSLGGYLSIAYAEKYPQHIDRLILLSPAGIPNDDGSEMKKRMKEMSYSIRFMIGLASTMWNSGITPSSFVRAVPETRGRNMVSRYIEQRLPAITCVDEQKHLTEYLYTNAALPGSGEDCLNKLLAPFAFAKRPALNRISKLNVKNVAFVYGQNDWMDASAGIETKRICNEMRKEGKHDAPIVSVLGVKDAGHLLMLENWEEFNSAVVHAAGDAQNLPQSSPKPYYHDESQSENSFFRKLQFQRKGNPDEQT